MINDEWLLFCDDGVHLREEDSAANKTTEKGNKSGNLYSKRSTNGGGSKSTKTVVIVIRLRNSGRNIKLGRCYGDDNCIFLQDTSGYNVTMLRLALELRLRSALLLLLAGLFGLPATSAVVAVTVTVAMRRRLSQE